jgi:hypothetical protein
MLLTSINLDFTKEKGFQSINPVNGRIDKSSAVKLEDMPKEAMKLLNEYDRTIIKGILNEG